MYNKEKNLNLAHNFSFFVENKYLLLFEKNDFYFKFLYITKK